MSVIVTAPESFVAPTAKPDLFRNVECRGLYAGVVVTIKRIRIAIKFLRVGDRSHLGEAAVPPGIDLGKRDVVNRANLLP